MSEAIRDSVTRAMADVFDVPVGDISPETSPETLESWDSVNHLSLVLALEQIFGISFDLDEIPDLVTLDAIVGAVGQRTGAATP